MNVLPIYAEPPISAVEAETPRDRDPTCKLCPLSTATQVKSVCMGADGDPGGLFVVGKGPGREEDLSGRPNVGRSGKLLRALVRKYWTGPVAYDNAVKCHFNGDLSEKDIEACRGFLSGALREVKPTRVVALGAEAALSILGRSVAPMSVRRGYGWLGKSAVPVFFVVHPAAALRNRFIMRMFEEDLSWALMSELPVPTSWKGVAKIVCSEEDAQIAIISLRSAEWFAFDVETAGKMFDPEFRLLSVSCTTKGSADAWVWDEQALSKPETCGPLKAILSDPKVSKGGQNVKYDQLAVRLGLGVPVKGVSFDTLLWRRLLDPEAAGDLGTLAELVGMGGHKEEAQEALASAMRSAKKPGSAVLSALPPAVEAKVRLGGEGARDYAYALIPKDVLCRYNARDSVSTAYVADILGPKVLEAVGISRVWGSITKPAMLALEHIERWGIAVSNLAVSSFQEHLREKLSGIRSRFTAQFGAAFNPASQPQVSDLLYKKLRLAPLKMTDGGKFSTDRETLESLKGGHPVVDDLLSWRRYSKFYGTYAEGLLDHIRADGRVHPNFHLAGARSGRLSCSDPNLQNIPRAKDSAEGKMARDCFVAPEGRILCELDYSQIELRVAAMLSGDPVMLEIFEKGDDYHLRTAQMVSRQAWGIEPSQVEEQHRTQAKVLNFSTLYGATDETNAAALGCTNDQAARLREAIFGNFKRLEVWIKGQLDYSRRHGCTWTWWDSQRARCRPLWKIADEADGAARSRAEHGSWNSQIQGTASDFCTASVAAIVRWILDERFPAKLVLTVHDSIILEVDEGMLDVALGTAEEIMIGWPTWNGMKLAVDAKVGHSWGSLQKYAKNR